MPCGGDPQDCILKAAQSINRCWQSPEGIQVDWRKTERGYEPVYEQRGCPLELYGSPLARFAMREYGYAVKAMTDNAFEQWVRDMPAWYVQAVRLVGECAATRTKEAEAKRKQEAMRRG